jgi:NitT/TauT family transport system permease protein
MSSRPSQLLYPAVSIALVALVLIVAKGGPAIMGSPLSIAAALLAVAGLVSLWRPVWQLILAGVAAHTAAILLLRALPEVSGQAGLGFWAVVIAAWLTAWAFTQALSDLRPTDRVGRLFQSVATPLVFGLWILVLWEIVVRGFNVPQVLLPAPSLIWRKLIASVPILAADFRQTFKAVLFGYVVGGLAGFMVAILADRVPFLRRGLLPIGNLASALPIIGIAPVMVMWFGFDWQSKAAVVVVMTFFPMLVNTIAGLAAAERMERDLMRTYGAGYWQTLLKLRLPAALPFIFNALKINSTLALIGAIVAEFFGTPVVGMGFRISTEVGRMGIDMVWAEIAMAALAGSLFYGLVSLVERAVTFWHPSYRAART